MRNLADSFIIIGHKSLIRPLISSSVVIDSYQVPRAVEAWPHAVKYGPTTDRPSLHQLMQKWGIFVRLRNIVLNWPITASKQVLDLFNNCPPPRW